ncbi:Eukaryotic translation initiation factor 3 subunit A [Gossypium arboreum]|uniref:Eukaryotic translation initiation factor 3 subunit A n=2 Tax=Gossypium arboreum TaxID=29729 RepID=A0A0B0N8G4_GOSAR|nr:hypothetical protein PVK06_041149 [Gossypium arboreum]KHG07376.1 Eukaryotic translation initiation factor 3 subunit A [Gossypium arboreum]KHG07377.1 Eukaryotic translation initiation factor 3 subunit A [Gossypium arboreum]
MANLIGFNLETKLENREVFSRSLLLTELVSKGVLNCATQEVKDLYHLLEHDFLPVDSASKIQPLLLKISKLGGKLASASSVTEVQLSKYVPALEKLTLRLLKQVFVLIFIVYLFLIFSMSLPSSSDVPCLPDNEN